MKGKVIKIKMYDQKFRVRVQISYYDKDIENYVQEDYEVELTGEDILENNVYGMIVEKIYDMLSSREILSLRLMKTEFIEINHEDEKQVRNGYFVEVVDQETNTLIRGKYFDTFIKAIECFKNEDTNYKLAIYYNNELIELVVENKYIIDNFQIENETLEDLRDYYGE